MVAGTGWQSVLAGIHAREDGAGNSRPHVPAVGQTDGHLLVPPSTDREILPTDEDRVRQSRCAGAAEVASGGGGVRLSGSGPCNRECNQPRGCRAFRAAECGYGEAESVHFRQVRVAEAVSGCPLGAQRASVCPAESLHRAGRTALVRLEEAAYLEAFYAHVRHLQRAELQQSQSAKLAIR